MELEWNYLVALHVLSILHDTKNLLLVFGAVWCGLLNDITMAMQFLNQAIKKYQTYPFLNLREIHFILLFSDLSIECDIDGFEGYFGFF